MQTYRGLGDRSRKQKMIMVMGECGGELECVMQAQGGALIAAKTTKDERGNGSAGV